MSDIAISVENLSKKYSIGNKTYGTLRNTLANVFNSNRDKQDFWALKDVNFTIKRGEAVGIIGRNGAGKSTLLKILSKITSPTTGKIVMDEFATSLLEVGTGFHPELTGRENIFLNGSILGMTRSEIKTKLEEIIEFSGVEKFIDTPVKHYSSGMYVRLAFSVSAHIRSNILLVDEVLAVGDVEFQQKCLGKMEEVTGKGRTVLFVSHNLDTIKMLCNKSILIDGGQIVYHGDTSSAISKYESGFEVSPNKVVKGSQRVTISSILFNDKVIVINESCEIEFELINNSQENMSGILLDIGIDNFEGKRIGWLTTGSIISIDASGRKTISIVIDNWNYKPGRYYFTTYMKVQNEVLEWMNNRVMMQSMLKSDSKIAIPPKNQGDVLLNYRIKL
jgi:lipopolysaccharide transport system ATP-binding protein